MKKNLNKLMSFLMSIFMILEFIMPTFYSLAKEENLQTEYKIYELDDYGLDENTNFSINKASLIKEEKLDSDTNIKFALETLAESKNIKLITRRDFLLYDKSYFDNLEEASEEFEKTKEKFNKQGLEIDIDLYEEEGKYFIYNNQEDTYDTDYFGKDYEIYKFDLLEDFDFEKEGLQRKLEEDERPERFFLFDFEIQKLLDEKMNMISLDPEEEKIRVNHEGDLLGLIIDDSYYSLYTTEDISKDLEKTLASIEEIQSKEEISEEESTEEEITEEETKEEKESVTEIITEEESIEEIKEEKEEDKEIQSENEEKQTDKNTEGNIKEENKDETKEEIEENKDNTKEEDKENKDNIKEESKDTEQKQEESKTNDKSEKDNTKEDTSLSFFPSLFSTRQIESRSSTGSLTIKKVDEDGNELAGAEFQIVDSSGNTIATDTTDQKGLIEFTGLYQGNYDLIESKPPSAYKPLDHAYRLYVNDQGVVYISEITLDDLYSTTNILTRTFSSLRSFVTRSAVNEKVTVTDYRFYVNKDPKNEGTDSTTLYANKFDSLSLEISMDVADSVKSGDTFEIEFDKNIQPLGLIPIVGDTPNTWNPPVIKQGSNVIAFGKYDKSTNKLTYTFTKYVDTHDNVKINFQLNGMGPNRDEIQNTGDYSFTNTVAGDSKTNSFNIDYSGITTKFSGIEKLFNYQNFIPEWNKGKSSITHVLYLNPMPNSSGPRLGFVLTYGEGTSKSNSNSIVYKDNLDYQNASYKVYKVPSNLKANVMVGSMKPNLYNLEEMNDVKLSKKENGQIILNVPGDKNLPPRDDDFPGPGYIIIADIPTTTYKEDINVEFNIYLENEDNAFMGYGHDTIKVFGEGGSGQGIYIDKLIENYKVKGEFEINKLDQDNNSIGGVTFTLTSNSTQEEISKTSDANGKIKFDNLDMGEYTLKEVDAPYDYEKITDSWTVTVDDKGITSIKDKDGNSLGTTINEILNIDIINNKKKGTFKISKLDENDSPLAGAEFRLTKDGEIVESKTSDKDGSIIFENLPQGTYKLEEIKAPDGFIKTKDTWTIVIDKNGLTNVSKDKPNNSKRTRSAEAGFSLFRSLFNKQVRAVNEEEANVIEESLIRNNNTDFGKSTISTNALYNPNADNFKVTVDIIAGEDTVTGNIDADVVFIIPAYYNIANYDDFLSVIREKISAYGPNSKIAIIINDSKTSYNANLNFDGKDGALNKLVKSNFNSTEPNDTRISYAFHSAIDLLIKTTSSNKLIVNFVTKELGSSTPIKNQYTSAKENNINIENYYIGGRNSFERVKFNWDRIKNNSFPNVNSLVDASLWYYGGAQYMPIYDPTSALNTLRNNLPVYGEIRQKDIEKGQITINLNPNFVYLGDPDADWLNDNNGKMPSKEFTLNAGESKSLSFVVSNIPKDTDVDLVESISYKPRVDAQSYTIKSPRVRVYDKKSINISNKHTGLGQGQISAELFRKTENSDWIKLQDVEVGLSDSISEIFRVKDDDGNAYFYKLENISTNENSIIIDSNSSIEIGELTSDKNIEILSHYDDNQRKIVVESKHSGLDGRPLSLVLQAVGDSTIIREFTLNTNESTSLTVPDKDLAGKKYTYYLSVKQGSLPEDIKFNEVTYPEGKIVISTEFKPIMKDLKIKNTHDGSNEGQIKAILLSKELSDFKKEITLDTNKEISISVKEKDEEGKEYNYYLVVDPHSLPSNIVLKGISKDSNKNITINTKDRTNFSVGVNWKGVEPKGTITVNLKEGVPIALHTYNSYFYSSSQENMEIASISGSQENYNYTYHGENGNYIITVTDKSQDQEVPVITVVNKKAEFEIKKVDESDSSKVLAGATFQLKQGESLVADNVTTDSEGKAKFTNLEPGDYELIETKAPEGYKNNAKSYKLNIDEDGSVTMTKLVEELKADGYVGDQAYLIKGAKYNKYYYIESNYYTIDISQKIEKRQDGLYYVVNAVGRWNYNYERYLSLVFNYDKFDVYKDGIKLTEQYQTENIYTDYNSDITYEYKIVPKSGAFSSSDLISPIKEFYVMIDNYNYQKITDSSYFPHLEKSMTVNEVEYNLEAGTDGLFEITNQQKPIANLKLHKVDGLFTTKSLEGVEFTLTKLDEYNQPIETSAIVMTTDSEGNIEFTNLDDGNYKLTETKALSGYYDNSIDYLIRVENGKVFFARSLNKDSDPKKAKTNSTKRLRYELDFLTEGKAVPNGTKMNVYSYTNNSLVRTDNISTGNLTGNYDFSTTNDYYFDLDLGTNKDNYEIVYIKSAIDSIKAIIFEKDKYEELLEASYLEIGNYLDQENQGKLKIIKKDTENSSLLAGAEFEIVSSNGYNRIFTTDENGEINITNLPGGVYTITEIKAPDGYVVDSTPREIVIGAKFEIPQGVTGRDVSSKVHFVGDSSIESTNPEGNKVSPIRVQPNNGEGLKIISEYSFDDGIKPGDYFYVDISSNLNAWGVRPKEQAFKPILASALGMIAEGKFVEENGHYGFKYTFTEYLDKYYPSIADLILTYTIEPYEVTNDGDINIYTKIGSETKSHTVNVYYQPFTYWGFDENIHSDKTVNSMIKMTMADWENGEYETTIYVNRRKNYLYNGYLEFGNWDENNGLISITGNETVNIYKVDSRYPVDYTMPKSYGLNYNYLSDVTRNYYSNGSYGFKNNKYWFNFGNDLYDGSSYIIVIRGTFNNSDRSLPLESRQSLKAEFIDSYYYDQYNNIHYNYKEETISTGTEISSYSDLTISDGLIKIEAFNKKNKIEFTKVSSKLDTEINEDFKPLKDVEFELRKKNDAGEFVKVDASERKSDDNGKFSWEGLAQGKYEVWETKAPKAHILPNKAVSSFEVNELGEIINILNDNLIIVNQKHMMEFYLDKIWKDGDKKQSIKNGVLQLSLTAPEGEEFPGKVKLDPPEGVEGRKYRIIDVSDDKKTITFEFDLAKAYQNSGIDNREGIMLVVPHHWPDGNYSLKEVKAPAGFIKTNKEFTIYINQNDRTVKLIDPDKGDSILYYENDKKVETIGFLEIENQRGKLPSTGQAGILIFTIAGAMIMILGSILYGLRKKESQR